MQAVCEVDKPSQKVNYSPFEKKLHNKFLLWHGVKPNSLLAVMREGARLPESSFGLTFGAGIYLHDCFSKAASISCNQKEKDPQSGQHFGIVFLCEAALGEMHRAYEPDQFINGLPMYSHSVYGVG